MVRKSLYQWNPIQLISSCICRLNWISFLNRETVKKIISLVNRPYFIMLIRKRQRGLLVMQMMLTVNKIISMEESTQLERRRWCCLSRWFIIIIYYFIGLNAAKFIHYGLDVQLILMQSPVSRNSWLHCILPW